MLPGIRDAGPEALFAILREISVAGVVKGRQVGTLYSGVWDVTNGELHLVFKRDYDNPRTFKLSDELAKGEHSIRLTELYPSPSRSRAAGATRRTCSPQGGAVETRRI